MKIYLGIFFYLFLSFQLNAQTFIDLEVIQNEFDQLKRNYLVQPKTIELESKLSNRYDSCYVHILYTINDTEIVSKEVPRVRCFCKNGDEKSFSNSRDNKKSDYPHSITELLTQISEDIDSPIIIINDIEISNSGEIYLGAITVKFKNGTNNP